MHPLEKETLKVLRNKKLVSKGEKIVVGVSGGPDSIALLNVLGKLISELNITLVAAYLDHGLRPDETAKELDLVRCQANAIGVEFDSGAVNVKAFAKTEKLSSEDAARILRYNYLNQVLNNTSAQKIAVAHTADDQAEEILLRLIRGTGRKGLAGMDIMRDSLLIRPFLDTYKRDIVGYLEDVKLSYCQDSSNLERTYLRNRVRLDLIPYLKKNFNPGIKNVLRQTAVILDDEENLLDDITKKAYNNAIKRDNSLAIKLEEFKKYDVAIQRRIVEKLLLTIKARPGFRQINQIIHLSLFGSHGYQIHLSNGLRGIIEGNKFVLSYPAGRTNKRGNLYSERGSEVDIEITGPGIFQISDAWQVEVFCQTLVPALEEIKKSDSDFLDLANIQFPIRLRTVLPGDKFFPLGSPGRKKVADFLRDIKLPNNKRAEIKVLENNKTVIALLGVRIDHNFMIKSNTTEVMRVKLSKL